jgi:hypothetical protein
MTRAGCDVFLQTGVIANGIRVLFLRCPDRSHQAMARRDRASPRDNTYVHQRSPNILAPRRFTEKVQWRKLFDMNSIYPVLSDKLAVSIYSASRVGDKFLVPLLWSGAD